MQREKLSHKEVARLYGITAHDRVASWERIYLEEGPEGLYIERRGRGRKGRPPKKLKPEVEEDLLAEVQRLRAENAYLNPDDLDGDWIYMPLSISRYWQPDQPVEIELQMD